MKPFPFQIEGARFLAARKAALLADEMGVGKTMQAVLACDFVQARKIVVVCPAIARPTWAREFKQWQTMPRRVCVAESPSKRVPDTDVLIVSYEFVTADILARVMGEKDVLIIDEAHYLANWKSKRTQFVLGKDGARARAKHVWCLSGTPMRSDPSSLWPMLYSLAPELIEKRNGGPYGYEAFVDRYCKGYYRDFRFVITGGKNLEELAARIKPFYLRRRADDVVQLPPIFFSDFELDIPERALPGFVLKASTEPADDDEIIREARAFGDLGDQASWREKLGAVKAGAVVKALREELASGQVGKIVVFAWHESALDIIENGLREFGVARIDGNTSPAAKSAAERVFQTDPACRVLAGNIMAAGVAVTLTAAHHVFFVEWDWTPLNNAQAALRTRRIGQKETSFVRFAVTRDPMDRRVTAALRRKTAAIAETFGEGVETSIDRRVAG